MTPHPSLLFVGHDGNESMVPALRRSFEVTAVSSEAQAVRALRTFRPTIVITELDLPDGDGLAVCRQSKELLAQPPLVLVTATTPERVAEAFLAGCDAALMKPFQPNLLHARIGLLLRQPEASNLAWRDVCCPGCGRGDAISFDTANVRNLWYACMTCRHAWNGPAGTGPRQRWIRR
jgi:DNA-binding response OmpR family regulator